MAGVLDILSLRGVGGPTGRLPSPFQDFRMVASRHPINRETAISVSGFPQRKQQSTAGKPMRYVGGSGPGGAPAAHVGGETYEMNAFKDGELFSGPSSWHAGFNPYGGMERIQGYSGTGIPTNQFAEAFGRAPTATDYTNEFGGLTPQYQHFGSLDDFHRMQMRKFDPNQVQQPAAPDPFHDPSLPKFTIPESPQHKTNGAFLPGFYGNALSGFFKSMINAFAPQ